MNIFAFERLNMSNPKVSIIIATYNSERTIYSALKSVAEQDFQDWECIVVDGASKDRTVEIVKEFEAVDSRFRHISEPDKGIYDAFNKGWKMAQGEWVHYLGSDDRVTNDGMQLLIEHCEGVDLLGGSVYLVRENEPEKIQLTNGADGCHQAFLTRRSVLSELNGFDENYRILADKDFLVRLKLSGYVIRNFNIPVAYYNTSGFSQNISNQNLSIREKYRIYKKYKYVKHPFIACAKSYIKGFLVRLKYSI